MKWNLIRENISMIKENYEKEEYFIGGEFNQKNEENNNFIK